MHRLPAELLRRLDVGGIIVNEADLAGFDADALGCQPEEFGRWLLVSEHGGIENSVEIGGEPELLHQIGGTPMLLIGRQIHRDAFCPQGGEIGKQRPVQPGIILEPVIDQRRGAEIWRDLRQHTGEPGFQLVASRDDVAPVGLEEFLLDQIATKAEIAFQIGEKVQSIAGPAMNQYTIDIDHQDFHAARISQLLERRMEGAVVSCRVQGHKPLFFLTAIRVSLWANQ